MHVIVLLNNCIQNITSLSLMFGTTIGERVFHMQLLVVLYNQIGFFCQFVSYRKKVSAGKNYISKGIADYNVLKPILQCICAYVFSRS